MSLHSTAEMVNKYITVENRYVIPSLCNIYNPSFKAARKKQWCFVGWAGGHKHVCQISGRVENFFSNGRGEEGKSRGGGGS